MCSVVGCVPGRRSVERFQLPDDPERRHEWVQFLFEVNGHHLKGSNWTDINICGEHFTNDCFVNPTPATGTMQLKCSAVPCVKPESDQPLKDTQCEKISEYDNPTSNFFSSFVPLSDEESQPCEEADEEGVGSDGEWSPTEDILLSEELREDQSQDEDERGFHPQKGLRSTELCTECGSFYFRKPHTCRHKRKPFSCNMCGTRCISESSLKNHSKIHHETYEHPCKYCYATFRKKVDKLKHEWTHQGSENPYKCPDCPEMFASSRKRNAHLSQHRTPMTVQCGVCGIKFCDLHHLRRHSVVHTGLKPFKCTVCQRGFNQQSNLKSHMRVHTGEKPYRCRHCYKCFNHNVSLKSHVQRYHTEKAGMDHNKGERQKLDDDPGCAEDNGDTKDLDSEFESVTEKQNTEEAVQTKSERRRTGRPRGRPKRAVMKSKGGQEEG